MPSIRDSKRPFSLLIKPASADCNLHCAYCFYLDRSSLYPQTRPHRMTDRVLDRLILSYMATDQPQYSFGWQGGEPTLMGTDFFRRVVELQKKYGKPGSVVGNGLQTNATLIDDKMASLFAEYNFLLGVSLDGPEDVHNTFRLSRGGDGSYRKVVKGIGILKKHRVVFNILTAVSTANANRASEIYHYLLEHNQLFQQYIPIVEFDFNGNPLPFTVSGLQWGEFLCTIFDEWYKSDTERVSIRLFDAVLNYLVDGKRIMCTMGEDCRQYFVVEHNGDIYPCDFFVDSEKKLGNILNCSWEQLLDSPVYRSFGIQKSRVNPLCKDCPHLIICAGDCLKHRFYGPPENRSPETLSWLCEGWKMFYNHALPGLEKLADSIKRKRAGEPLMGGEPSGKIGRNDPCPCGSGKKFKHCHGKNR